MTSSRIRFVPATAEAVLAYYGGPPPYTFKGYIAMLGDKPVGVGGIYYAGRLPVAFSECKDEMETMRKDKARAVRLLERLIKSYKVPVFAIATLPTSIGLLTKLGFEATKVVASMGPVMKRLPDVE